MDLSGLFAARLPHGRRHIFERHYRPARSRALSHLLTPSSAVHTQALAVDQLRKNLPMIAGSTVLVFLCLTIALVFIYCKYREFNATLYKKKKKQRKEVDPTKRVESFMDAHFTAGVDNADDVTVNPGMASASACMHAPYTYTYVAAFAVLIHRIEEEKKRAKVKKKGGAKVSDGQHEKGRSGGLARLNLHIEDKKDSGGGKIRGLVVVEQFLAGQEGVDITETAEVKNTQAGKKKINILDAAKEGSPRSPGSHGNFATSRAKSRAAMRAQQSDGSLLHGYEDSSSPDPKSPAPGAFQAKF